MDAHAGPGSIHDHSLQRLIVLSDAVFAIAMTLLALELRPPADWDGTAPGLFTAMRTSLIAYAISFFVVAAYWNGHRRSFGFILRADAPLTALTLLSLGLVTLLPAVARLLAEHGSTSGAFPVYLGLVASIGLTNALVWGYASLRRGLMAPSATPRFRGFQLLAQLLAPLLCWVVYLVERSQNTAWAWVGIPMLFVLALVGRRWARQAPPPVRPPASPIDRHADDGLEHPPVP